MYRPRERRGKLSRGGGLRDAGFFADIDRTI